MSATLTRPLVCFYAEVQRHVKFVELLENLYSPYSGKTKINKTTEIKGKKTKSVISQGNIAKRLRFSGRDL